MVVTNTPDLAERVNVLRNHGSRKKYHAEVLGFNSRLDSLQAAILGVKLNHLDNWNNERRRIAYLYNELFENSPVIAPIETKDSFHVYHQYTIRVKNRDKLAATLKEMQIGNMIYYPVPIHMQQLYVELGYQPNSLPNSEQAGQEVISLPIYPELSTLQVVEVAEQIKNFTTTHS